MSNLRSNLRNVRGLGSAKTGTAHFIAERSTALALVPLSLWFAINIISMITGGENISLAIWLNSPFNTLLFTIFIIFSFWHSKLGIQVIIEDYIHAPRMSSILSYTNSTMHIMLGLLCLMAIFQLHFLTEVSV